MKNKVQIILVVIISGAFYIAARSLYQPIMDFLVPEIDGIAFYVQDMAFFTANALNIAMVFACIPIAVFLVWQFSPVVSVKRRILSVLVVAICMWFGTLLRLQYVKNELKKVNAGSIIGMGSLAKTYPLEEVNIPGYLFAGLLTGSVISYFTLRESRKEKGTTRRRN